MNENGEGIEIKMRLFQVTDCMTSLCNNLEIMLIINGEQVSDCQGLVRHGD
jgi:hypothetical protein